MNILVSGKVQGVFFRESTRKEAEKLKIAGYVRNLADGRVEITAQGTHDAIEALIAWCATGPPAARVETVEVQEIQSRGMLDFRIQP